MAGSSKGRGWSGMHVPPPELKKGQNMPNIDNKNKMCLEQISFYPEYSKAIRKIFLNSLTAS